IQNAVDSVLKTFGNLTVIEGSTLRSVKKSGKSWRVELNDRSRFKVHAVIDESTDAQLYQMVHNTVDSFSVRKDIAADYLQSVPYTGLARTGVAVAEHNKHGYTLPLGALVPAGEENLFLTRYIPAVQRLTTGTETDIPLLMHVGQAI